MRSRSRLANPWVNLPKTGPFVLPEDKNLVEQLNRTAQVKHQIRLEVLPVPFLGSLDSANVVLLNLNPGIVDQDFTIFRTDKNYVEQNRRTLTFKSTPAFFYLGREFAYTEGYKWWFKRLRVLIEACGHDTVATRVMCIQYSPYHSKEYKETKVILPSQQYSFSLVRQAIETKKTIIVMRKHALWLEQVPELRLYPYIRLTNTRSPYVTPGNMAEGKFQEVVNAVRVTSAPPGPGSRFGRLFRPRAR